MTNPYEKSVAAVRRGRTANTAMGKDPLPQPQNKIMINIDGFLIPALINKGSSMSILLLSIYKHLKKVLLPPQEPLLKSAFNTTASIANCSIRLLIGNLIYVVDFRILSLSSHDVILGCNLLSENEAIRDYVNGEISLRDEVCLNIPPS